MDEQNKKIQGGLVSTIRSASKLAAEDISFYKSLDKSLAKSSDNTSKRLLNLINRLVATVSPGEVDSLDDSEDVENNWKDLSNVIDNLFEKTDTALDDLRKGKSNGQSEPISATINNTDNNVNTVEDSSDAVIHHSKTLLKPQIKFSKQVDNSRNIPFKPLLTSKPNDLISLKDSIKFVEDSEENEHENDNDGLEGDIYNQSSLFSSSSPHYIQPYSKEILEQEYPKMVVQDPIPSTSWADTQEIYVDTLDKLNDMLKDLKKSKEIAVDLEHHDYRSYYGIVCLMQISNREKDWIVDTLVLRDELQILNEVFTNASIIKVLHGSHMDIMWLQRDFGLYIVSLFDTYAASKSLSFPKRSLAYLLETYAKFTTSKKYQLADWRIRPLPTPMKSYARSDTHFLLNIFDQLRNRLIKDNKLFQVLKSSRSIANQRYEYPGYGLDVSKQCNSILFKYKLSPNQEIVVRELYELRDDIARKADESARYILPNHFLVALSISQPTTVQELLNIANSGVGQVRKYSLEIVKAILKGKEKIEERADKEDLEEDGDGNENELEEVESTSIVENYDEYLVNFNLALEWQKNLFSIKSIEGTVKSLRNNESKFFSHLVKPAKPRKLKSTISSKVYKERVELVGDKLNLYVPIPPNSDEEDDYEEEEEEEDVLIVDELEVPSATTSSINSVPESNKSVHETIEISDSDSNKRKASDIEEEEEEVEQPLVSKKSKKNKRRKLKLLNQQEVEQDERLEGTALYEQEKNDQKPSESFPNVPFNAFDFKSAPTVLTKPEKSNKYKNKKSKNKDKGNGSSSFNPYGNLADSVRPAKKISRPIAGQTYTFKKKR